jgi:hypothetical protein
MEQNPYESPSEEAYLPPDNRRGWRWLGTLLIVLAIVPYVPMTVTPFLTLAGFREKPAYITSPGLFAVGVFNGCVCVALFLGGRWLRKTGLLPPATKS